MDGFVFLEDIAYGNADRHRLDMFMPEKVKTQSGIILFIHGGGWVEGDKSVHRPDAEYFCKKGYVSASINYRYVTENINVADVIDDVTAALKKIKSVCGDYGMNTEKVIISGGSAGAHLSLLYAYTKSSISPLTPVAACVYCPAVNCYAGDFLMGISGEFEDWKYEVLSKCCGVKISKDNFADELQQKVLKNISPMEYVSSSSVPTAVFAGKEDALVPFSHIEKFIAQLDAAGIKNDLVVYEKSGHALDKDPEAAQQAKNVIEEYARLYF